MNNVMIDNETLAVTADAVIMSIGAVRFDLNGGMDSKTFYVSISVDSNLALGRRIEESTLTWWLQQPRGAQGVFFEPKTHISTALLDLADFIREDDLVWSNGASFDIPQLELAFKQCDIEVPWKFYNARCMRTYKDLPGAAGVPRPAASHNALQDAIDQVRYIQQVHAAVFGKKEFA